MICKKCGRANPYGTDKCNYCGEEMPPSTNGNGFSDILRVPGDTDIKSDKPPAAKRTEEKRDVIYGNTGMIMGREKQDRARVPEPCGEYSDYNDDGDDEDINIEILRLNKKIDILKSKNRKQFALVLCSLTLSAAIAVTAVVWGIKNRDSDASAPTEDAAVTEQAEQPEQPEQAEQPQDSAPPQQGAEQKADENKSEEKEKPQNSGQAEDKKPEGEDEQNSQSGDNVPKHSIFSDDKKVN
ncbi:MAG: hypothetical protein Q4G53_07300 [Clostridia bacterium]|nr:hypothetical protein [Clostridia bacterium]